MNDNKKRLRRKYWFYVCGWTGVIYSTLYIVRPVCNFLKEATPFELLMNVFAAICLCFVAFRILQAMRKKDILGYALLAGVVFLYIIGLKIIPYPEERLHLIEYGVLAFFIFRAFKLDIKSKWAYPAAFMLTSVIGWGDEGIQYLLPNRYYQLEDVLLNSISGALGLFLTFIVHRGNKSVGRVFCAGVCFVIFAMF